MRDIQAYAITTYAHKKLPDGDLTIGYGTSFGMASDDDGNSERTMRKKAMELCYSAYPESEGYQNHQVGLMRVDGYEVELGGAKYVITIQKK